MSSTTAVKDPVCGMDVDTATAVGHTEQRVDVLLLQPHVQREVRS